MGARKPVWAIWLGAGALVALLAVALTRAFTQPVLPLRRLAADEVPCPACGKRMDEGYLALLSGLHWRRRPRLHAFRCVPCEVVTFQYGDAERR